VSQFSYEVAADVFRLFPGYRLGVVVFDNVDNTGRVPELTETLCAAEQNVRDNVTGNVADHPSVAPWRNAYRTFGAKPSEHRSSIESLMRRVLKHDSLPRINTLVDIGTIVSLRELMPAGVHPIRRPDARIELRLAREGDLFLASDSEPPEMVTPGEVVLADQSEVLTRRWTWRQSVITRTLPTSRRVFFNVDGLSAAGDDQLKTAMEEIQNLVSRFCGGELVHAGVLSSTSPRFTALLT
jgi:DNA/RNA-binding domain of Phe-tRNA-synthetase-like protein